MTDTHHSDPDNKKAPGDTPDAIDELFSQAKDRADKAFAEHDKNMDLLKTITEDLRNALPTKPYGGGLVNQDQFGLLEGRIENLEARAFKFSRVGSE